MDVYQKSSLRQALGDIEDWMFAGVVPFIQSSPGLGKSAMVASIAAKHKLKLIDHRLSTSDPADLSGYPDLSGPKAVFKPFDLFPIETDEIPEGYVGWLLFLDEFNSASKATQAAAYKLILDRYIGQLKLHPNVIVICAGNRAADRAITTPLGTAMQSRLAHIEIEFNPMEFIEDVVDTFKWDSRISAYLRYKPSNANDFRGDHNNKTFCCPRTWEFINKLIQGRTVMPRGSVGETNSTQITYNDAQRRFGQVITAGIAMDFLLFTELQHTLPKIEEVVINPHTAPMPSNQGTRFAMLSHLIEYVKEDNLTQMLQYVRRMPMEFQVTFLRMATLRYRSLVVRNQEYKDISRELGSFSRGTN